MSYSARKPYTNIRLSIARQFDQRVRFIKELVVKESMMEKPYLDGEYPWMQFKIPTHKWGPWQAWRRPSLSLGPFGRVLPFESMDKMMRLLFIYPLPRCWIIVRDNSGDCMEVGEYAAGFGSIFTGAPHQGWNWEIWTDQQEAFRIIEAGQPIFPSGSQPNNPYNLGIVGGHRIPNLTGEQWSTNIQFFVQKIQAEFEEGEVRVLGQVKPRGHGPIHEMEAVYPECFTSGDPLSKVFTRVKPIPNMFDPRVNTFKILSTFSEDAIPCEGAEFEVGCGCTPGVPAVSLEDTCPGAETDAAEQYYEIVGGCPRFGLYTNSADEAPYPPDEDTEWTFSQYVERRFLYSCRFAQDDCAADNRYFGVLDGEGYWSNVVTIGQSVLCGCDHTIEYTTNQMDTGDTQDLTVSDYDGDCEITWALAPAGACESYGELSDTTGETVTYTAPDDNEDCLCNAVITISCCGEVVDTLVIAVNDYTTCGAVPSEIGGYERCQMPGRSGYPYGTCCCISWTCWGVLAQVSNGDSCVAYQCGGYGLVHCIANPSPPPVWEYCVDDPWNDYLGSSNFQGSCAGLGETGMVCTNSSLKDDGCCPWFCA